MRFTFSIFAGTSGLILLGIAFFGQPANYLREGRLQWHALVDGDPPVQQLAQEPGDPALEARMQALQQEVTQLRSRLESPKPPSPVAAARAALQAVPEPNTPPPPAWPASPATAAKPAAPAIFVPPRVSAPPAPPAPVAIPSISPTPPPPAVSAPAVVASLPALAPPPLSALPLASAPAPAIASPSLVAPAPAPAEVAPRPESAQPSRPAATASVPIPGPERHEPAALASAERRDIGRSVTAGSVAAPKPPRPETEDARSVLARLRQAPVPPAPVSAPPVSAPPVSAPPVPDPIQSQPPAESAKAAPSPGLSRLIAARAALSAGRIADARRLLQETQLLIVFRPAGPGNEDVAGGRAAGDVAHALEALGGSDTAQGRYYIDRGVSAMSGMPLDPPTRDANARSTGFAPAYPQR